MRGGRVASGLFPERESSIRFPPVFLTGTQS